MLCGVFCHGVFSTETAVTAFAEGGACTETSARLIMKMRTAITIGATLVLTCAHSAKAQTTYRQLEEYAGVVLAYEITKDTCAGMNSTVIKDRVSQFDSELSTLYGQHWLRAKFEQRGPLQLLLKGNCSLAAVGMLPLSMRLSGDAEFQQAFQRIANKAGPMGQFAAKSNEELQNLPGQMAKAMDLYASGTPTDSTINARPNAAPVKPPASQNENTRLSKYVVETAFACLRLGITANKDSTTLYPACLKQTAQEVEPLNAQMTFRLGFLVYRTAHAWGVEKGAPIKLPSPFEEEKRCSRDANPAKCMTQVTAQAFVEFIEILSHIGSQEDLDSFRNALVESGG